MWGNRPAYEVGNPYTQPVGMTARIVKVVVKGKLVSEPDRIEQFRSLLQTYVHLPDQIIWHVTELSLLQKRIVTLLGAQREPYCKSYEKSSPICLDR